MAESQGEDGPRSLGRTLHSAKEARATSSSWASLPREIRLAILEETSRQKYRGWASCAAVCKEWQAVLEPKNFHRLKLQASCLEELECMVIRQRDLVRHILLNIQLPRYACHLCQRLESSLGKSQHGSAVTDAVVKLFSILSAWKPTGCLMLELNAYSPSDSEHWFKNYHFGLEHNDGGDLVQQLSTATAWHDPDHGWVNGQQVESPSARAVFRLFSQFSLQLPEDLPEVRAVTDFAIRRQFRRQISPMSLGFLWKRLPGLANIIYEPPRVWRNMWKFYSDLELAIMINEHLPSHVRRVTIFEDCNDQLAVMLRNDTTYQAFIDNDPMATPALLDAFAWRSRGLEHLSVSFLIDAEKFFESCLPSATWLHLQSLTLTSTILKQAAHQKEISGLLLDASVAALRMTQLERMVLWNRDQEEACAVIYDRNKTNMQASLTWRGTWDFELNRAVSESWQKVDDSCYLRINNERVKGVINCHGDAVYHLRLPGAIIDPRSLREIREEGAAQGTG